MHLLLLLNFVFLSVSSFVRPSIFSSVGRPPTIRFSLTPLNVPSEIKPYLIWRWEGAGMVHHPDSLLGRMLNSSGFSLSSKRGDEDKWIAAKRGSRTRADEYHLLRSHQKICRTHDRRELDNKARMWGHLKRAKARFGKEEFAFVPETYILPKDRAHVEELLRRNPDEEIWLAKPPNSALMMRIRPVTSVDQLPETGAWILQKYVWDPYLVLQGRKTELRVFVLTTGMDPLRIYVHNDWITRLGPSNYSANSTNKCFLFVSWAVSMSHREECNIRLPEELMSWNKSQLLDHMTAAGFDTEKFVSQVNDAIVKTVLATLSPPPPRHGRGWNRYNMFEFWGADILIDRHGLPHVLEFNASPGLQVNGMEAKHLVKMSAFVGAWNTVGVQLPPRVREDKRATRALQEHMKNHLHMTSKSKPNHASLTIQTKLYERRTKSRGVKGLNNVQILQKLTPDVVRLLVDAEEELERATSTDGRYTRLYPTSSASNAELYLQLSRFDPYYDRLQYAWELEYASKRDRGRRRLRELIQSRVYVKR